jgi:4-cresol dehydrogenase (hydroxylating)
MTAQIDASALEQWIRIVGQEHVVTDARALRAAETGTYATGHRIPAIVRPADRAQVQECMRAAQRTGVSVYPISSGRNWGYGSRMPASDGCVLLDLGRMNRIVDFSEELAYVTVEPGVTQAQLYSFLQERRSGLWMDATGASPDCSLIGKSTRSDPSLDSARK